MPYKAPTLFPSVARELSGLGERLRLARLRRGFAASTVAVRAGIARATLARAERGDAAVALGTYARILHVIGLAADIGLLARDDELGRKLQDLNLPQRQRAPRRTARRALGGREAEPQ